MENTRQSVLRDIRKDMLKEGAKRLKKKEPKKESMKGEGPPPIMLRILQLRGMKDMFHKETPKDKA